jgi:hypothetical protein
MEINNTNLTGSHSFVNVDYLISRRAMSVKTSSLSFNCPSSVPLIVTCLLDYAKNSMKLDLAKGSGQNGK